MSKQLVLALVSGLLASPASADDVIRCGWYANPTPGNHWLSDADATWYLSTQGGPVAKGWLDLPAEQFDFGSADRWVKVNGDYGYGCACITGQFGTPDSGEVLRVTRMKAQPIAICDADPALPGAGG